MKTAKISATVLCVASIVLLVTGLLFAFTSWSIEADSVDVISFAFVILAEVVFTVAVVYLAMRKTSGVFSWSANIVCVGVYFAFTVLMVFARVLYFDNTQKYALHQILGLAVIAVLLIMFRFATTFISETDNRLSHNMAVMQDIENRVLALVHDERYKAYHAELSKVYDEVKYCDKTVCDIEIDTAINATLMKLETVDFVGFNDVAGIVNENLLALQGLLKRRRISLVANSRGGF